MKRLLFIYLLFLAGVGGYAQNNFFFEKKLTLSFDKGNTRFTVPEDKMWFVEKANNQESVLLLIDQEKEIILDDETPLMIAFKSVEVLNCNSCKGEFTITQFLEKAIDYSLIDTD